MLATLLFAWCLVAITVTVHTAGLVWVLRTLPWSLSPLNQFWSDLWWLIRVTSCLILIHLVEISIWGLFYLWRECLPDAESAFYFAGVTYTTLGYGDLILPKPWRMLGPIEGLTGILMCGLSTGMFFAVVSKLYVSRATHQAH